jgi:hypothetical protein
MFVPILRVIPHMSRAGLENLLIPKLVFVIPAHLVSTTSRFPVLSSIPCSIFSPSSSNSGPTVELLSLEDQMQIPLQDRPEILSESKNRDDHDLDVFISVEIRAWVLH